MPAHSLLGASSASRWLACPGSFALSRTAPPRPSSIYAAAGTLAHRFIELGEAAGFPLLSPEEIVGKEYQVDGHTVSVDENLLYAVNFALDYLRVVREFSDWMVVEHPVRLDHLFPKGKKPPVPVFGTMDGAVYTKSTRDLEVIDFKSGAGIPVNPAGNEQLMFYAAGAAILAPERPYSFTLTIIQPLTDPPVRSWSISPGDLQLWIQDVLLPGIDACANPDAPLLPGDHCRFCPSVAFCPALRDAAMLAAKEEFSDAVPEVGLADMPRLLEVADQAELWIARLREMAVHWLENGERILGWELVPTRPTRKWLLDEKALENELKALGLAHVEIWEERIRSPAQLEKLLRRLRTGRAIWAEAQNLAEKRSAGVRLGRTGRAAPDEFDEVAE